MKELKRITGMLVVLGVIMMGASNARAGLLMSDLTSNAPCTESIEKKDSTKVDHGVIVIGLIQIFGEEIIEKILGTSDSQKNCGVIVIG